MKKLWNTSINHIETKGLISYQKQNTHSIRRKAAYMNTFSTLKTPVIGIMPLWDEKKESLWMYPGYLQSLEDQGAVTMILPLTDKKHVLDYFVRICDGFLLTGGHDVCPTFYNEEISTYCGATCILRDKMDSYIFMQAVSADKPVLGICRGIQLMNVALGGTLYQDLPSEAPSKVDHHMAPPYDREAHKIQLTSQSPLAGLLNAETMSVNSCHHQAIKKLAPPLKAMGYASDGIVEAAYIPDKKFIWGVQWHPEFFYQVSEENRKLLGAFLAAAGENHA